MSQSNFSDADKAFFKDGYKMAMEATKDPNNQQQFLSVVKQQYQAMDGLIDALSAQATRQQVNIDCRKGCDWCCHQPIYGISHEFVYLWKHLQEKYSEEELKPILSQAFKNYQKRGRLKDQELLSSKAPCPLLKDGACMAYEARPMACRIYLSMSEKSCRTFYDNPNDPSNHPALLEFPLRAGQMMNEGFNKGLKMSSLAGREFLMEEGLLIAHNNGEAISDDDISKNPLFNVND